MARKASQELIDALLDDPETAVCPVCGEAGFYDNRNSPKKGKGPDFKCKNKDGCDDGSGYSFGVFLPKERKAASGGGSGSVSRKYTSKQLKTCYADCAAYALKIGEAWGRRGVTIDAPTLAAVTATLFIAHTNNGALDAPAPTPAAEEPPPPKRPPAPPAPDEDADNYSDETLPF